MGFFVKSKMFKKVFLVLCLIGQSWSTTQADEGDLILPVEVGGNIELLLKDESAPIQPSDLLQVFVGDAENCCDGKSAIAGKYRIVGQKLIFDPSFDFVTGQSYTVSTRGKISNQPVSEQMTEFTIGAQSVVSSPEVIAIYPSGDEIAENTLRFYIHFSEPMQPHRSTEFIRLVDESGEPDLAAFMTFKQELWNEDRTRLTLLMDPGRIKRGVATNIDLGPALLAGNRYSIVIEDGWPNAGGGQELVKFEKRFTVSKSLRVLPNTDLWQFSHPRNATRDALKIIFDRPFDYQLAQNAITVRDDKENLISGTISIEDQEKTWSFVPDTAWESAEIRVIIDARLEDTAGNNFRELLDHSVDTDTRDIDEITIDLYLESAPH